MSLSRQLCGTVKPHALISVKSGYSRAFNRSFRMSMGSQHVQAGRNCRTEATPKTRKAASPPSPGRSTAINSIFSNFRFYFWSPTHPYNGPRSVKSGQDTMYRVLAMSAKRMAAINILGLDIIVSDEKQSLLIGAATRPAFALLIDLLPSSKPVECALMASTYSVPRGCCIREIIQSSCKQKGAQSALSFIPVI